MLELVGTPEDRFSRVEAQLRPGVVGSLTHTEFGWS